MHRANSCHDCHRIDKSGQHGRRQKGRWAALRNEFETTASTDVSYKPRSLMAQSRRSGLVAEGATGKSHDVRRCRRYPRKRPTQSSPRGFHRIPPIHKNPREERTHRYSPADLWQVELHTGLLREGMRPDRAAMQRTRDAVRPVFRVSAGSLQAKKTQRRQFPGSSFISTLSAPSSVMT